MDIITEVARTEGGNYAIFVVAGKNIPSNVNHNTSDNWSAHEQIAR